MHSYKKAIDDENDGQNRMKNKLPKFLVTVYARETWEMSFGLLLVQFSFMETLIKTEGFVINLHNQYF